MKSWMRLAVVSACAALLLALAGCNSGGGSDSGGDGGGAGGSMTLPKRVSVVEDTSQQQ